MKIAQALIAGICLIALSCASFAAEVRHTSTIKSVYPQANGTFVIVFDTNALTCTNTAAGKYHSVAPLHNGMTDEGTKKLYAAALMALATDKAVMVAFDDATSDCYVNRLIVMK